MTQQYDITVIGGGMVGAALALGAAKQGKNVALIEGVRPKAYDKAQPMDIRVSAIAKFSVNLLEDLGAWHTIQSMRVCPYRRLETWEHPECRTKFDAKSLGIDTLGYIVENRLIQLGLWEQIVCRQNIKTFCPDSLAAIECNDDVNVVTLASGEQLTTKLVVGADGAHSLVRQIAGIGITAWDYRQHCMLINVTTAQPQQDITWQWFTPDGPRAFLPLNGNQASLVWYDSPLRIRRLVAMEKKALKQEIVAHFPDELGDIDVIEAGSFPLVRRHAQTYYKNRCVLVGDAAHTINPLAGQGVNLGFKDVAALLAVLDQPEWDTEKKLAEYEKRRRSDNLLMQAGMDVFYTLFSNQTTPLKLVRNMMLKAVDSAGPVKEKVLKYALGLSLPPKV